MRNMKTLITSLLVGAAAVALPAVTPVDAQGNARSTVDIQPIVQIFDDAGNAVEGNTFGSAKLIRRSTNLMAIANLSGLTPGGLYTFWWVVIPEGSETNPHASFIANGAASIIGRSGRANITMKAESGQQSIEGFPFLTTVGGPDNGLCNEDLEPAPCFRPLDFDISTAEVHVEVAYHGQVDDMTDEEVEVAKSDFWTGPACPSVGEQAATQPHCPVSLVSVHEPQSPPNRGASRNSPTRIR